jgi:peroxiredoxin
MERVIETMTVTRDIPCVPSCTVPAVWARYLYACTLVTLLGCSSLEAAPAMGQQAPDFALKTFVDGNVRLSEFRGEVVVLNFWAAWCGPCQQELPRLNDLFQRYQRAGLVMLGVNLDDDMARAGDMSRRLGLAFPLLFDPAKAVGRLYELDALPMTVFIDREGVVRHVHETFRVEDGEVYLEQIRQLLDE